VAPCHECRLCGERFKAQLTSFTIRRRTALAGLRRTRSGPTSNFLLNRSPNSGHSRERAKGRVLYSEVKADGRQAMRPPHAGADETRLLRRIGQGDLQAFEALYRIYHPRLTRFLTSMLGNRPLVEEVLNDTMMVVWKRPDRFNGTSKVSTWIFAIAYRTALKARSRFDIPVEDRTDIEPIDDDDPERSLGQSQVRAALLSAMGQLSPQHRAVLDLTYFQDAGCSEIAEILDCPVGTVKTRMHHARRYLKTMLDGRLGDWL
jgi:RNA polymerase sigma-70 factor (ECF subfamily)